MKFTISPQIVALVWLTLSEEVAIAFSFSPEHASSARAAKPNLHPRSRSDLHLVGDDGTIDSRRIFMKKVLVSATAAAVLHNCIPAAVASDDDALSDALSDAFNASPTISDNESPTERALDKEPSKNEKKTKFPIDPRYFLAGGGCAAFSHGIATPFDVIKTKMQADPDTFDSGFKDAVLSMVKTDGPSVLLTGLLPTLIGFGVEGAIKFGVYESLKPVAMSLLHADDKFIPYLVASVVAGAVASLMLVPMERTRIKMVTSGEKTGPLGGIDRLIQEEGLSSIFFGYTTMLTKQVPYTVTKQVSFELFATSLFALATSLSLAPNEETRLLTTVASAFCASILACTVSQPGDVLLTKTFKENEKDSPIENAVAVYEDKGIKGFYAGYSARLAHVASIVTSQLVVYDVLKQLLGLPATGT